MKSPNDLIKKLTGMILELLKHTETGMRKLLMKKRSYIPTNKCCASNKLCSIETQIRKSTAF